jgi:hypothetical protein
VNQWSKLQDPTRDNFRFYYSLKNHHPTYTLAGFDPADHNYARRHGITFIHTTDSVKVNEVRKVMTIRF